MQPNVIFIWKMWNVLRNLFVFRLSSLLGARCDQLNSGAQIRPALDPMHWIFASSLEHSFSVEVIWSPSILLRSSTSMPPDLFLRNWISLKLIATYEKVTRGFDFKFFAAFSSLSMKRLSSTVRLSSTFSRTRSVSFPSVLCIKRQGSTVALLIFSR